MKAAIGFSSSVHTQLAVEEALSAATAGGAGAPDLVLLFATSDHAEEIRRACQRVAYRFGAPTLLGGSTTGVISTAGEHEGSTGLGAMVLWGVQAESRVAGSANDINSFLDSVPAGALTLALPDPRRQDPRTLACLQGARGLLVGAGVSGSEEALFGLAGTAAGEGQVPMAWIDGAAATIGVTQGATAATPFYPVTRARAGRCSA